MSGTYTTRRYLPETVWPQGNPGTLSTSTIFAGLFQDIYNLAFLHLMRVNMGKPSGRIDIKPRAHALAYSNPTRRETGLLRGSSCQTHSRRLFPVCCPSRHLQFVIGLVQQVFRLLSMALHVPLIGLLRGNNFFISLPAQALCGGKVGMPCARYIARRALRRDRCSNNQNEGENHSRNSGFQHSAILFPSGAGYKRANS